MFYSTCDRSFNVSSLTRFHYLDTRDAVTAKPNQETTCVAHTCLPSPEMTDSKDQRDQSDPRTVPLGLQHVDRAELTGRVYHDSSTVLYNVDRSPTRFALTTRFTE